MPSVLFGASERFAVVNGVASPTSPVSVAAHDAATADVVMGYSTWPAGIVTTLTPMRPATLDGNSRSMIGRVCTGLGMPVETVSPARTSRTSGGIGTPR